MNNRSLDNNSIKEKLISAIKNKTPKQENTAKLIANLLGINKESAYRRLRGDINFSFEEIVKIADELSFSIDEIIEHQPRTRVSINLNLQDDQDAIALLSDKLKSDIIILRELRETNRKVKVRMAVNCLFPFIILKYDSLSRFYIYKWFLQNKGGIPTRVLKDFVVPQNLVNIGKEYVDEFRNIANFTLILDSNYYISSVRDINYFYNLGVISPVEYQALKEDLLASVRTMEKISIKGRAKGGSYVDVYISSVNIDTAHTNIEIDNGYLSRFIISFIHSLDSDDKKVGLIQKKWLDSIKKQSTSISRCGEIERFRYFNSQRDYITKNMG